jgi:protein-S-isoprenylcysteine O-methyltransferase Ste14
MPNDDLFLRRAIAFLSGALYWAGVFVQARRVRKHIGRSPNIRPRGAKEKLLWVGWFLVIVVWLGQPVFLQGDTRSALLQPSKAMLSPLTLILGIALTAAGYAGTIWCYAAMGSAWRIGINRKEKISLVTSGPYRTMRHPIYSFQVVMLAGVALLLPTALSIAALVVHFACVLVKASDEEHFLLSSVGEDYRSYILRTGRLFPRLAGKIAPPD